MGTARRSLQIVVVLVIAGCATAPVERSARPEPVGGQAITIEMVRFTFEPDTITAKTGTPIKVTAVSNSRIPHNITVLSLDGQAVKTVDIPARATVTLEVPALEPGRYVFYCDKFLHRWPFRMEGRLVVQ